MPASSRVAIWASVDQRQLISDALRSAELELAAIGSPLSEDAVDLSNRFSVPRLDDVRQVLQCEDADLIWLAAPEPLEADARRLMSEGVLRVVTSEPQYGPVSEVIASDAGAIGVPLFVPLARRSAGYRAASDVLTQFGKIQCVQISFRGGRGQGTLLAKLFDAMDVLNDLCGPIESVNAGLSGPLAGVPEEIASLRGHATVNVRFKPNLCACVALSDSAGSWFRGVTVLGEGGCIRINDDGFEWIGTDGEILDHHESSKTTAGELIGQQIRRLLDGMDHTTPPPDHVNLLTLCEAARLSCLTGQDEAPAKLLEMLARP